MLLLWVPLLTCEGLKLPLELRHNNQKRPQLTLYPRHYLTNSFDICRFVEGP
jgi:hypothetical protein